MDIKDFAKMLDGRQYMDEMTEDEEKTASENEFVVVFGYFVDRCELRGAVHDEIDCYDGGIIRAKGLPKPIDAVWCPADKGCSWFYETDMPHEEFNIFNGDELFCIGIVIDIKAARLQMTEHERLVELLSECKPIMERILDDDWYENEISDIAGYLLRRGAIVQPIKLGDIVYAISRGDIIPIIIDRVHYSNYGIDIFGRNEMYFGYGTIMLDRKNKIGLEWYKTKKEAEAALKKMESANNG